MQRIYLAVQYICKSSICHCLFVYERHVGLLSLNNVFNNYLVSKYSFNCMGLVRYIHSKHNEVPELF